MNLMNRNQQNKFLINPLMIKNVNQLNHKKKKNIRIFQGVLNVEIKNNLFSPFLHLVTILSHTTTDEKKAKNNSVTIFSHTTTDEKKTKNMLNLNAIKKSTSAENNRIDAIMREKTCNIALHQ